MTIKENIIRIIQERGDVSVKELVDILHVSKQGIHIAIKKLLEDGDIQKLGRVPKTVYRLKAKTAPLIREEIKVDAETLEYLLREFLVISEIGDMLEGLEGFSYWCKQRKLPLEKTLKEYLITRKKYDAYFNPMGLVDGMEKLRNTTGFDQIYLDNIYYLDFYAIERFGKTRLGTILHYAKQGQNKFLMKILVDESKIKIAALIASAKFDAKCFVPPTIRREVQLMKYLETQLKINLTGISIQKISGIIPVPQKSLSKIEERIRNADNTFVINETVKYDHILLLDDAVGSGATFNQIAMKIKQKGIANKVTAVAIVGSFKGFDVITDV